MASQDKGNGIKHSLRDNLFALYHGRSDTARNFRFVLLTIDIVTIIFFISLSMIGHDALWIYVVEGIIAVYILLDLAARIWVAPDRRKVIFQFATLADMIILLTLIAPLLFGNFLFLRVLRALRLLRSYRMLADLREDWPFFKRNEELIQSAINLTVFLFVMTALVYVMQVNTNPGINNYVDALYFTVTALTTTGFGDITLQGTSGRLLSVVILLLGVALFLRLVQTIFRPSRVIYECPDCGLKRHDADAVHCKHCGRTLHIETTGDS